VAYAVLDTPAIHGIFGVVARHLGPDQGPPSAAREQAVQWWRARVFANSILPIISWSATIAIVIIAYIR
jgi:hypothetical protein